MKSIVEIDEVTLKSFRWPSCQEPDGRYTSCRYLADFILKDQDGVWIADMFVARKKESSSYSAEGTLLARPGSNEASIYNVVIPFIAYSIDFSEVGSSQRGYWMESNIKGRRVFYKLVRPHIDYRVQSDNMECKLHKFLELYDYLASLKHLFNKKGFIECNMTVHELHKSSNEAFDLNFVKENGTLLLLNLVNSLQELKCALLIDSVRELAELDRKAIFKFFPSVSQRAYDKALADGRAKSIREAAPSKKDQLVTEEDTELTIPGIHTIKSQITNMLILYDNHGWID